jgi:tRNA-modifying protein YgfZ
MTINISTSPGIFRWKPACWLRVSGEDAGQFLQGQFTNDLRGLTADGAVYGLWLSLKGKVLADSFVLRGAAAQEFWVGSYFSSAAVILERLEAFIIADDVVLEDQTPQWSGLSFVGAVAGAAPPGGVRVFAGRRAASASREWVYPAADAAAIDQLWAGQVELTEPEMARWRIAAGIPAVPADIGPGDLPNEAGLEAEAISYTKGCYLGQEVMARLKAMGQVRRRLCRVAGPGGAPAVPVAVFGTTRQAGEVRSAAADGEGGWIGLAMMTLLQAREAREFALAQPGAPATIRLLDTP